jgi:Planctomycete cytochrome C
MNKRITGTALALVAGGCYALLAADKIDINKLDLSKLPPASGQQDVTYSSNIKPLFEASCVHCHGEQRPKAQLRLDSLEGVLKGGKDGKVVLPGDSQKSLLVIAVARIDKHLAMPPEHRPGRRGPGGPPPGGFGGPPPQGRPPGGFGGHRFGPPPKPLNAEQVGLIRAWIDQGAK